MSTLALGEKRQGIFRLDPRDLSGSLISRHSSGDVRRSEVRLAVNAEREIKIGMPCDFQARFLGRKAVMASLACLIAL